MFVAPVLVIYSITILFQFLSNTYKHYRFEFHKHKFYSIFYAISLIISIPLIVSATFFWLNV